MTQTFTTRVKPRDFEKGLTKVIKDYDPEIGDYEMWTEAQGSYLNNLDYAIDMAQKFGKDHTDVAERFFGIVFGHYNQNDFSDVSSKVVDMGDLLEITLEVAA